MMRLSMSIKNTLLLLATFFFWSLLILTILLQVEANSYDLYTDTLEQRLEDNYKSASYGYADTYYYNAVKGNEVNNSTIPDYIKGRVEDTSGKVVWTNEPQDNMSSNDIVYTFTYDYTSDNPHIWIMDDNEEDPLTYEPYYITLSLDSSFVHYEPYSRIYRYISFLYSLKDWLLYVSALSGIGFLLCLFALIRYLLKTDIPDKKRLPVDVYLFLIITLGIGLIFIVSDVFHYYTTRYSLWGSILTTTILNLSFLLCLKRIILTLRLGKNHSTCLIVKGLKTIPKHYAISLMVTIILLIDMVFIRYNYYELDNILLIAFCNIILLLGVIFYMVYHLSLYRKAIHGLASGHWDYQVPTRFSFGFFEAMGTDINKASEGMEKSLESQLKSERLKTELLTNVTHDLKTPLTSIINYSDLIRLELDKENIDYSPDLTSLHDFSMTLHEESRRLLALINNLIEASRASTGNLDCKPEPCDISVILSQVEGEYEQGYIDKNLELIIETDPDLEQPADSIKILADQSHLHRVFDNLMTNIVKYSQENTRVYLTTHHEGDYLTFSLQNISKDRIHLTPDELVERFVQGDSSRHTQGHGLGLSIVQSLMQLQKGKLALTIQGDLFMAQVSFPIAT